MGKKCFDFHFFCAAGDEIMEWKTGFRELKKLSALFLSLENFPEWKPVSNSPRYKPVFVQNLTISSRIAPAEWRTPTHILKIIRETIFWFWYIQRYCTLIENRYATRASIAFQDYTLHFLKTLRTRTAYKFIALIQVISIHGKGLGLAVR